MQLGGACKCTSSLLRYIDTCYCTCKSSCCQQEYKYQLYSHSVVTTLSNDWSLYSLEITIYHGTRKTSDYQYLLIIPSALQPMGRLARILTYSMVMVHFLSQVQGRLLSFPGSDQAVALRADEWQFPPSIG